MPTNLHIIRRILELYGPQSTKQIFVHYPEAGSVNHLKNDILRRLEGNSEVWRVHMGNDAATQHVWMTREQKLSFQQQKKAKLAAKETSAR